MYIDNLIYTYMYAYDYIFIIIFTPDMYVKIYMNIYLHIFVKVYAYMYVRVHLDVGVYGLCVRVCACLQKYIQIYFKRRVGRDVSVSSSSISVVFTS